MDRVETYMKLQEGNDIYLKLRSLAVVSTFKQSGAVACSGENILKYHMHVCFPNRPLVHTQTFSGCRLKTQHEILRAVAVASFRQCGK